MSPSRQEFWGRAVTLGALVSIFGAGFYFGKREGWLLFVIAAGQLLAAIGLRQQRKGRQK